jgi:class 3 adenylate cyclase
MKRRLAVILASDVAGYSALVAADEENTIQSFTRLSRTMSEIVERHEGRVFNTAGDALLAEFNGPVAAVRCAVDIHEACRSVAAPDEAHQIRFRIGIAVGDVIVAENNDLLGDAVNVAARLCAMAEPATTCISQEIERMVRNKVAIVLTDAGAHQLKNIPEPVHVFRITDGVPTGRIFRPALASNRWALRAVAAAAALLAGGAIWFWSGGKLENAGPDAPFISAVIPLVSDATRLKIGQSYPAAKGQKALALSNEGDFYGIATDQASPEEAQKRALADCQTDSHRPCFVYAINDRALAGSVVIPMPWPGEFNPEQPGPPLDAEKMPLAHEGQRARVAKSAFVLKPHNAVALGMRGLTGWAGVETGETKQEAARRALEFCGFRTGSACLLYAVDGGMTTELPATRPVTGVLVFADASEIPESDRKRLMKIYGAGGWRALAKGRNGTWHAVAGKPDEASATSEVLASCTAADRECVLQAIGHFRVDAR